MTMAVDVEQTSCKLVLKLVLDYKKPGFEEAEVGIRYFKFL
jgi:hypothetical protein